jgi:glycogen debranching enzyme
VLATGDFELVKSTLRLLKDVSEKVNGNGRVVHEISTSGAVYNPGNTQETAHFVMAVWKTFQWTGDREFLAELYPFVKKSIQWLTVEMDANKDLFPEGYGIMEVKGLSAELIDVAVYTQQALECASLMAEVLNEGQISEAYKTLSLSLKDKINSEFWDDEEKHYMDFYATAREAMTVADGAIEQYANIDGQADDGVVTFYKDLKEKFSQFPGDYSHGWSTNLNWVMNTPMETGIAPDDKALAALDKMSHDYIGQWGPYLSAVHKKHSMTISTGVQAVAECRYRRIDRALIYMNDIVNTFGYEMPGSINEMMPDYGCFVQAWTNYGIMVPTIEYIFGLKPSAHLKKIALEPQIPTGWNDLKLSNQKVGDNTFRWAIEKEESSIRYTLNWENGGWDTEIRVPYSRGMKFQYNKKSIVPVDVVDGKAVFKFHDKDIELIGSRLAF